MHLLRRYWAQIGLTCVVLSGASLAWSAPPASANETGTITSTRPGESTIRPGDVVVQTPPPPVHPAVPNTAQQPLWVQPIIKLPLPKPHDGAK